jgi:cytochrome c-type biogenesis protein CcmH
MTAFLIAATAMALVAILLVSLPLLRKRSRAMVLPHDAANVSIYQNQLAEIQADLDIGTLSQEQFEHARNELERRLLQDVSPTAVTPAARNARWPGIVAAAAIPLVAAVLYWQLGNPHAIAVAKNPALAQTQQVEDMLPKLEKHLAEQPTDATGWKMLGKAYMALDRYPDAVRAFDKLAQLTPEDAQSLADYADALAMAQGQTLQGKPRQLLAAALQFDPNNVKALYLSGFAAVESGDAKQASTHWNKLLQLLPANSEDAVAVRQRLAELGQPVTPSALAGDAASISGTVRLSAELKVKVQPGDTLFVFARAAQGPRMPLAILKLEAKDLPASFSLDDSMAMSPQMKLSNFPEVVIGARISRSGNAMPQPGDLEGTSEPVKLGAKGVAVAINRVVP